MRFFVVLILMLKTLSSCSSDPNSLNEEFVKKYHAEVAKINEQRKQEEVAKQQTFSSKAPTESEVEEDIASKIEYFPYVNIAQIGDAPKNQNLPNRETYEQSKANNPSNSLPKDIFEISYNLSLYPPFRKIGAEFDGISIPSVDRFGISTNLSDKKYLLVGNNSLQQAVDLIDSEKTADDVEITKMLVLEKKKIQKENKSKQFFGEKNTPINPSQFAENTQKIAFKKQEENKAIPPIESISGFVKSIAKTPNSAPQK